MGAVAESAQRFRHLDKIKPGYMDSIVDNVPYSGGKGISVMSRTHGELFGEIGRLVFNAHQGAAIDLASASSELADRYSELRIPAEAIARAIARSAGAVGVSMALVEAARAETLIRVSRPQHAGPDANGRGLGDDFGDEREPPKPAYAGLASGGRIAFLS